MSERKEYKLELSGMSCGSCESLVKRVASQNGAEVSSIDAMNGKVTVWCEEDRLATLKTQFAEKGFREKSSEEGSRGDPQRVINYTKSVIAGHEATNVETTLVGYAIGSASILLFLGILMNLLASHIMRSVLALLPLAVLVVFGVLMMLFSYHHINCYRKNLSCANGMMVGMTVGMMSGFLAGALVGATNGMFIGSLLGMAFGIGQGFVMGKPAGIMGAMEGIMAGIMAGTMGAMLSVMMINDNLILFLYILFGLCALMVGSLSYMMHREVGPTPANGLKTNFSDFASTAVLLTVVMLFIMIYGPKNGIVFS